MRTPQSVNQDGAPTISINQATASSSSRQRHTHEKYASSTTIGSGKKSRTGDDGDAKTRIPSSPMTQRPPTDTDSDSLTAPEPGQQSLPKRSVAVEDQGGEYGTSGSSVASTEESFVDAEDTRLESSVSAGGNSRPDYGHLDSEHKSLLELDKPDAERQLSQYRERLSRDIARREMTSRFNPPSGTGRPRVSPIQEETMFTTPQDTSMSEPTTASSESTHTIRGGTTPGLTAGTPSYPFPRMVVPSFAAHQGLHHPFTTLSPTTGPGTSHPSQPTSWDALRLQDKVLSNPSTPASHMTFLPPGLVHSDDGPHDFPSPNLYDLSLMLSAEPGLEAWWSAVVQIMTEAYKAERVTLAIPADSTDLENVPWGQKATYNVHMEDEMSMGYMARGSSLVPSSTATEDPVESPSLAEDSLRPPRPGIQSRHSFTAYEDKKERNVVAEAASASRRPNQLYRSHTSNPTPSLSQGAGFDAALQPHLNKQTLEEHDAMEGQQKLPSWETPFGGQKEGRGKMMNVLQALDYEADPLIDHNGVMRVLERGKVIALTRTYPYLDQPGAEDSKHSESKILGRSNSPEGLKRKVRRTRTDSTSKLSSAIGASKSISSSSRPGKPHGLERRKTAGLSAKIDDDGPRPATPKYDEYEQAPPSPWSQSPAPSPAVRHDTNDNPFFTDAMVDEETFNPSPAPPDYTSIRPPEAIGIDNSWTVLHIPLTHPLLSKPNPVFKLDATLMAQKSSTRARAGLGDARSEAALLSPEAPSKQKHAPIAILSILSPIIPYPSNLRYSLEHLAPHLATSFSMCRHYTNLELEVNGLQKRRPQNAGFGAIGHDGRPLLDPTAFANMGYLPSEDVPRGSVAGSMTSPSDYSSVSRSGAASAGGTPMWDPSTVGLAIDPRHSGSATAPGGDSYFNTKSKTGVPGTTGQRSRRNSKDNSPVDKRSSLRLSSGKAQVTESGVLSPGLSDAAVANDLAGRSSDEMSAISISSAKSPLRQGMAQEARESQAASGQSNAPTTGKLPVPTTPGSHRHTQLHSYGADFASTFQSLPPSSVIGGKGANQPQPPSRTGSISTVQTEMTPPSDRLKGLILDSLPAHVFVALPHTGEIVWVNSRFLTYRGKTSADLASDPWGSIHPDDRDDYLRAWGHSVRTGEQFSRTVRIRRFDGQYRWFYARAVASKDKRGVILQFLGSYMDIHDQHIAELRAARQEEIEASEAKHRLLANLIPQIIFTATEDEGITFANEQWLSYTGQSFEDSLGLGFMDYVHPDDLAKCRVPLDKPPTPHPRDEPKAHRSKPSVGKGNQFFSNPAPPSPDSNLRGVHLALSRNNSSSSDSVYELPTANLTELARKGVIKVATDSNGRLSYTTEIRLRSKFGDYRWHLVRCVEIDNIDFGNGASSYFGSATDINDHKLLETKLKEAMDSKGRFLSNMSHEIRTPLIGISGMVSFLQDTTLNEEQRDYTNTIQTSANSLLMIINDILDLSKVDAGMMKLNHEWFHTRSLIEDVNELVSTMAIAKRLELNYVVEEDVPAWVKGDKVRIRQVLLNVIGNAIKFTNQGEVFSRCKVVDREGLDLHDDEIMLEFSIIDTGRGFTKEEAELIFKPFSQIDGSSTRQHGGSGLGLVISRQLVELHGGKMEGTAIPGEGSTFTFTAKFGLPTDADRPEAQFVPRLTDAPQHTPLDENWARASKQQVMTNKVFQRTPTESPQTDTSLTSPPLGSSGSSHPSISSTRTHLTDRSSMSSINAGLARFSEAARASGQDLSEMKLDISMGKKPPGLTPTPNYEPASAAINEYRPPMYSILVISPQTHSREATTRHIEMTLPKDVAHQITALATVEEAQKLIGGDDPVIFTHVVVNLPSAEEIISLMDLIRRSSMVGKATILILSDSVQRQAVLKQVAGTEYEELLSEKAVTYIYKPVKPSRLAVIFDPAKERDLSIDRNRSTAQKIVENQKQSYLEAEKRMGNRGYKVLLVEDNPVNQKVLQKYLKKVGVEVEIAMDGVECTEKVFAHSHEYYSLILCDLHMPRKDGYQACREIRAWEKSKHFEPMPIIALSANVMSDVQEKCTAAGFNDYVTKPVDFIELSTALSKFF